jgi:hypothetical protein
MEIHLISSLTPDDENRLAPAILSAIGRVLDRLPVTYSVRVETVTGNAIHHSHTAPLRGEPDHTTPLRAGLEAFEDFVSPYVKR